MAPLGESFGPIGKPAKQFRGKKLGDIDRAEVEGRLPSKTSGQTGKGLKPHLALIFNELDSHQKMKTLQRSGLSPELLKQLHPDPGKELPAKIILIWLAQHYRESRNKSSLGPLTLEALHVRAKEKGYLTEKEREEDAWVKDAAYWKSTSFWKRFIKPLIRQGLVAHDEQNGTLHVIT